MYRSIFSQSLWSVRKSTFFWSLGLSLIAFVVAALYDSMASDYEKIVETIPPEFAAFVGSTSASAVATPAGFLGLELFGIVLPFALAAIGIGSGASMIGREEENGTLELLLSSPVARWHIQLEKILAIAVQLGIVCLAVWATIAICTALFPFDVSLVRTAEALVASWLFGMAFAVLAFVVQAITGRRALAIGIGAGFLIMSYFMSSLAPLVEVAETLQYVSPFYYYDGQEVLVSGLDLGKFAVLAAVTILLGAAAFFGFRHRDIGV